jgi:anti-sigma-K factor RskA
MIVARISRGPGQAARSNEVLTLYRSAKRWRVIAAGSSLLAACLALIIGWFIYLHTAAPTTLVAELYRAAPNPTADEITNPAFVVTVDLKGCTVSVRSVTARLRPAQSFQLWAVRQGAATPRSLGLIARAVVTTLPCPTDLPARDLTNAMLAVSVEPEGGSTSGAPTGSFVFVGKLVPAPAGLSEVLR